MPNSVFTPYLRRGFPGRVVSRGTKLPLQLPWTSLAGLCVKEGIQFIRWPNGVLFPGEVTEKKKKEKKAQGIRDASCDDVKQLYIALTLEDVNARVSAVKVEDKKSLGKSYPALQHQTGFINGSIRCSQDPYLRGGRRHEAVILLKKNQ